MQLGYSQFSHSQPYAHSPFQWPTIPTLWQTKPNKQTKNNQKTRNRSSFQHSDNIFNKNNSFRMWQRQTFLHMEVFFLLFFLFLEKSTKNWIFRKKSVAFFFFSYMRVKVDREGGERRDYIAANKEISKSVLPSSQKLLPLPPLPAW